MLHLRAIIVVILLLCALSFPLYKYWSFLSKGMSPSSSTQLLDQMEKTGVPDFTLQDLEGRNVNLSRLNSNTVVIVNFWASWCAPCVKEFPSLKALVEKMNHKVKVLAVSNDNERADLESFLKAFGQVPEDFIVVWDKDRKISELYGTQVLPESYIIKPGLKLVRKVAGFDEWDSPMALQFFTDIVTPQNP